MDIDSFVDSCKRGLKSLAKVKINRKSRRLGTDWEGYDEEIREGVDEDDD